MDKDKIVPAGEILVYQTEDGKTRVECRFEQETVWLSQALIGELFQVSVPTVNEHLKNIFEEAELAPEATIRKFRIVRREGQREVSRLIEHYNLGSGTLLTRFNCFFTCKAFCPEMIEDTVKIVNEPIKDKIQMNLIINNRAGGSVPLIAQKIAESLHPEKQQRLV